MECEYGGRNETSRRSYHLPERAISSHSLCECVSSGEVESISQDKVVSLVIFVGKETQNGLQLRGEAIALKELTKAEIQISAKERYAK